MDYTVIEHPVKWTVKWASGKLDVTIDVPKEVCKTEAELREYIASNNILNEVPHE